MTTIALGIGGYMGSALGCGRTAIVTAGAIAKEIAVIGLSNIPVAGRVTTVTIQAGLYMPT